MAGEKEPRPSRPFSSWTFFGGLLCFFGIFHGVKGCEEARYERGAARAWGRVEGLAFSRGQSGKSMNQWVEYKFRTADGRELQGRSDVLPGTFARLAKGGPVEIEYLPHSPGVSRVADDSARAWVFGLLAAALWIGGLALIRLGRRRASGPPPAPRAPP